MAGSVSTPAFLFSGLYYPEVLQDLRVWMRTNVPEITDEDDHEPFVQLLSAMALVFHNLAGLADHTALEALYDTARLRESVRSHLKLIGETLKQASPSTATLLCKLPSALTANATLKKNSLFSTVPTDAIAAIPFETKADKSLHISNILDYCYEKDGGTFTDRTANANTDSDTFQLWAGVPAADDALYLGHRSVFFDKLTLKYTVGGDVWAANDHVWEAYDGQIQLTNPTSVTDQGAGTMRLDLTSLLGSSRRTGASVVVTASLTGTRVTKTSAWSGTVNYVDGTLTELGMAAVSTAAADFLIGSEWREVPTAVESDDTTAKVRTLTFAVPETATRLWPTVNLKTNLGGNAPDLAAHWLRLRIIAATATAPTLDRLRIDRGSQYFTVTATQGITTVEPTAATATGAANQTLFTTETKVVEGSLIVSLDEGSGFQTWSAVSNFLASGVADKHYTVDYDPDGAAVIVFGDGTNGKVPAVGATIKLEYRTHADDNGNVGEGTVTVNRSGLALVSNVINPRAATGWKGPEGFDSADLERIKIEKPANVRAAKRLFSRGDAAAIATAWTDSTGAAPFARAKAVDEAFGAKTVEVLVVESGTAALPAATLTAFQDYLNGNSVTGVDGVILLNYKATVTRYTPKTLNVTATVKGGDKSKIEAAIKALLAPLAKESDGTYTHDFGGTVYADRIEATIFGAASGVKNVPTLTVNGVADGDVVLGSKELPVAGTVTVTIS